MSDKSKMDCRTRVEILNEAITTIIELKHLVENDFAWRTGYYDNEVTINTKAMQSIIKYIKQLKGEI